MTDDAEYAIIFWGLMGILIYAIVAMRKLSKIKNSHKTLPCATEQEGAKTNIASEQTGNSQDTIAEIKNSLIVSSGAQDTYKETVNDLKNQTAEFDQKIHYNLVKIKTQLVIPGNRLGSCEITSKFNEEPIFIDLDEQTCTCKDFNKKKRVARNTIGRFCVHLLDKYEELGLLDTADHNTRTAAHLGILGATTSAYLFIHNQLPAMFILLEDGVEWASVYCRRKLTGENIHNASGPFERHGWHMTDQRWSYGIGATGISLVRDFFKNFKSVEDLDRLSVPAVTQSLSVNTSISSRANPAINNPNAFGPDNDAYDIPIGLSTGEEEAECLIMFSYVDGKNQRSRRTVEFKKIQFYGSEGAFAYGFCRLRMAGRTFKIANISDGIDLDTGEVVNDFVEHLKQSWQYSVRGRLEKWCAENSRIARAWVFLMRGNKKITRAEYSIMSKVFCEILNLNSVSTGELKYVFDHITVPTATSFQRLVGGIATHHKDKLELFVSVAEMLVDARATPNFADQAALEFINNRLDR